MFVDWIPTKYSNPDFASLLLKQTSLVEKYIKLKVPILIFDRHFGISKKETVWLKRNNVKLFEPAINHRDGFKYLPFWAELKTFDNINFNAVEKNIDLAYKGDIRDKLKTFEKYYITYGKLYPFSNICYDSNINTIKVEEYNNYNVIRDNNIDLSKVKATIIIGNKMEYKMGFIDNNIFEALKNNCIPFMPYEHRYFRGIFSQDINPKSLNYWIDSYNLVYTGVISEIYDNIKELYPEFSVEYTVDIIKNYAKI